MHAYLAASLQPHVAIAPRVPAPAYAGASFSALRQFRLASELHMVGFFLALAVTYVLGRLAVALGILGE